jgi:hypothetical protein
MLKKLTLAAVALLMAMPALRAAGTAEDLTGKWSGKFIITMDGEKKDDVAFAVLKHKGAEFGGTIGPNEGEQWAITKAKVEETSETQKVTFVVTHPSGEGTAEFTLSLVKGHLVGKATISGGGMNMTAEVDLERVK